MKKLLSFLAAGIAALGLASCSGDLHNEIDPSSTLVKTLFDTSIDIGSFATFELAGDMQGWDDTNGIAFEKNDDELWEADFVAPDAEECGFCYLTEVNTTKGTWNGQIGGDKIEADSLPDGVKYEKKDNGFGGLNAVLTGLTAGKTYKMTVDASTGVYVFSIEITAAAKPTPYILSGYFVAGNFTVAKWAFTLDNCLYNYTTDSKKNVYYTLDTGFADAYYGFRLSQVGWSGTQIGNKELTVGEDYVELDFVDDNTVKINDSANCILSGANTTDSYRIYIKTTPDKKVYAKVTLLTTYNLSVSVTDLPAALEGKEFYLRGGLNGWETEDAYKATVTSGTLTVSWPYIVEGSDFDYEFEGKFSVGKASADDRAAGDGWGLQLAGSNGSNLTFSFSNTETTLNYAYEDSGELTTDDGCKYYVISEQ